MKKLMISAALAAVCCSAVVGYCDVSNANVVGYANYTIRHGVQNIDLTFKEVGASENITVGSLLPSALPSDHIICHQFHVVAKMVDGKLHWTQKGKIVDDLRIPQGKFSFRYLRKDKKETVMHLSGEVQGKWLAEDVSGDWAEGLENEAPANGPKK